MKCAEDEGYRRANRRPFARVCALARGSYPPTYGSHDWIVANVRVNTFLRSFYGCYNALERPSRIVCGRKALSCHAFLCGPDNVPAAGFPA